MQEGCKTCYDEHAQLVCSQYCIVLDGLVVRDCAGSQAISLLLPQLAKCDMLRSRLQAYMS